MDDKIKEELQNFMLEKHTAKDIIDFRKNILIKTIFKK